VNRLDAKSTKVAKGDEKILAMARASASVFPLTGSLGRSLLDHALAILGALGV
jgi:hypothetical protein